MKQSQPERLSATSPEKVGSASPEEKLQRNVSQQKQNHTKKLKEKTAVSALNGRVQHDILHPFLGLLFTAKNIN